MAVTSIFRPGLFDGQVFLITGGGTGIGRAIARELSSLGASVAICSRSMAHLEDTCASIKATGGQVLAQACDIRDEKQVNAQVQAVLERFGRLDGLVNNAGGQFFSPAENITPRGWQAVISASFSTCGAAFPIWPTAARRVRAWSISLRHWHWNGRSMAFASTPLPRALWPHQDSQPILMRSKKGCKPPCRRTRRGAWRPRVRSPPPSSSSSRPPPPIFPAPPCVWMELVPFIAR